jgi:mannan endo-1,4-beta-mannosidase
LLDAAGAAAVARSPAAALRRASRGCVAAALRRALARAWCVAAALSTAACVKTPGRPARAPLAAPPKNQAPGFELDGAPFCFEGANNYYAIYKPRPVVDDLFAAARALELRVLRVWGMLDRGSLDGSVPNADPGGGDKEGVYFQYWDPASKSPAYNDGPNGLERLDYVLARAAEARLKVIVVLVNNWRQFGGIDQYLMWYGRAAHDEFFTAPEVAQAYRQWLAHVLTRKNHLNGRVYRDDPTVFAWELANEPRMTDGSAFDRANGWDTQTLTRWASEMSAYVKTLDPNHLVAVGDEGFLNGGGEHWAYAAKDGVDHRALTALPGVDFGTFHLYPEDWGVTAEWGERWISEHLRVARELGKPALLEEYGVKVERAGGTTGEVTWGLPERDSAYRSWNEALLRAGGSGALAWMLAGADETRDGEPAARYPDYDHYAFYRDDATGRLLGQVARGFRAAPACVNQPRSNAPASPFVRVRRTETRVAFGWFDAGG